MKNFIQDGCVIDVVAPVGGLTSGQFYVLGALFGVVAATVAQGDTVALHREGVFTLPKTTGETWSVGDKLYWDANAAKFTKTAAASKPLGVAAAVAASGDATGAVSIEAVPEASADVALGAVIGGRKFVAGQISTATAADTVATGLASVIACGASLDDNPGDDPMLVSATIGDQAGAPAAGSIIVKTWKNTGGTDPTPLAASTFSKKVSWWAYGT